MCVCFCTKNSLLAAEHRMLAGRGSPVLFRGDHCFDCIINAESITSQKEATWKGKRMFKPFSEIVGNSVLVSRQNSQNNFFHETQVSNPTAVFKIKHSNPMQSKDKLNLILFCWGKKDRKILHSLLFAIQSSHYFRVEDSVEWTNQFVTSRSPESEMTCFRQCLLAFPGVMRDNIGAKTAWGHM